MTKEFPHYAPGVQEPFFLEKYPEYPVFLNIPENYSPEKAVPLFFFMHGGDKNTPPEAPFKMYLDPEGGCLSPLVKDAPFVTVAPYAP